MSFRDNPPANRFERDTPFGMAWADYVERNGVRVLTHVETPPQARGQGIAAALLFDVVALARAQGLKLAPRCSYAIAFFEGRPEARDVLA